MKIKDKKSVYKVAINATLGSFFFGYQLVNISCIERLFGNKNNLTKQETTLYISIITAALPLAAIIGSISIKPLMQKLLARKLMILLDVISILFMILQCYSLSFATILLARLGLGFTIGVNSGLIPQYIYSVTPKQISGSICSLHQVMLMIGVTFGYIMGFIINPFNVENQIAWRVLFIFPSILLIIRSICLGCFLQYQIPSKKLKQKQIIRLERYFYSVYQGYGNAPESYRSSMTSLGDITQNQSSPKKQQNQFSNPSLTDIQQSINSKQNVSQKNKALFICLILACSNQFCGINAILFYAKQLFMQITDGNADLSQVLIVFLGLSQVGAGFLGGIATQKISKKILLMSGLFGLSFLLGAIFYFQQYEGIVISCIFLHALFYNFSIGQLLMYYAAKMLQNTGVVMVLNWFLVFVVVLSTESIMRNWGVGGMCLLFCILLTIFNIILAFGVPSDDPHISNLNQPMDNYNKMKEDIQLASTVEQNPSQRNSQNFQQNKIINNEQEVAYSF